MWFWTYAFSDLRFSELPGFFCFADSEKKYQKMLKIVQWKKL